MDTKHVDIRYVVFYCKELKESLSIPFHFLDLKAVDESFEMGFTCKCGEYHISTIYIQ